MKPTGDAAMTHLTMNRVTSAKPSGNSASAAYWQFAVAQLTLGLWALVLRPPNVHPLWGATIVLAVVALLSLPILWWLPVPRPAADGKHLRRRGALGWLLLLGLLNAANVWLYFTTLQSGKVATAAFLHCFTPVVIAAVAPSLLGTRRDNRIIVLAVVAVVGLALMMYPAGATGPLADSSLKLLALGATGAVLGSAYVLINKWLAQQFTPEQRLAGPAFVATLLLSGAAILTRPPLPEFSNAAWLAAGGGLIGLVGWLFFLRGLQGVPAEKAGMVMLLEPLTGLVIGWLVFGERLGALGLAGAALLIGSSLFAVFGREKPPAKAAHAPRHQTLESSDELS